MKQSELKRLDRALEGFVAELFEGTARRESREASALYVCGLLLDGERKSVEPMAQRLEEEPERVEALRQRLSNAVSTSPWSDDLVRELLALKIETELKRPDAFIIDDTGFAKKGEHSVGVARQYSGTLGRTDNCQVAVSLHLAGATHSCPLDWRLYLPEEWTSDPERCRRAGIPDDIEFETKWQLALGLVDHALKWGLQKRPVVTDSGYGKVTEFRQELQKRSLEYLVEVTGDLVAWPEGVCPEPPPERQPGRTGRPRTKWTCEQVPQSLKELVFKEGKKSCRTVTWREGARGKLRSRFGAIRIRTAHGHSQGAPPGPEEWLLYEWPIDKAEPTKFWLSNLSRTTSLKQLVRLARLRWRVERDYQDMKGEVGLDHFEGRTWRGFHHHATLCAVAHAFLTLRQALFSPRPTEANARPRASSTSDRAASPDWHVSAL